MLLNPGETVSLEGSGCCVGRCGSEPRTAGARGQAQLEPCSCSRLHQSVTLETLRKPWGPRGGRRLAPLDRLGPRESEPGAAGRGHLTGGSRPGCRTRLRPTSAPLPWHWYRLHGTCQSSLHLSLSLSDAPPPSVPRFPALAFAAAVGRCVGGGGGTGAVTRDSINPVGAVGA